jgi:WD40 repeat protein
LDLSADGTRVLAATNGGCIGSLNVSTYEYTTLVRSHYGKITDMSCVDYNGHTIVATSGTDHTVRIWTDQKQDSSQGLSIEQSAEFLSKDADVPLCCALQPDALFCAVGYSTGFLRI